MLRNFGILVCAALATGIGGVAYKLRPRPVAITWFELYGNAAIYSTPQVPAGVSFAPCEVELDGLGRHMAGQPPAPTLVYTPGLVTKGACLVLSAERALNDRWYRWRGEWRPSKLTRLRSAVARALRGA